MNEIEALIQMMAEMNLELKGLKERVSTLETNTIKLKEEVLTLGTDSTDLKEKVLTLGTDSTNLKEKVFTLETIAEGESKLFLVGQVISYWTRFVMDGMVGIVDAKGSKRLTFREYALQYPEEWAQVCSMVREKFNGLDISYLPHLQIYCDDRRHTLVHPSLVENIDELYIRAKDLSMLDSQGNLVYASSLSTNGDIRSDTPFLHSRFMRVQKLMYQKPKDTLVALMDTTRAMVKENKEVVEKHRYGFNYLLACRASGEKVNVLSFDAAIRNRSLKKFLKNLVGSAVRQMKFAR